MECKSPKTQQQPRNICELIDTLWNVNFVTWNPSLSKVRELIDTLWNVNVFLMDGRTSPATQN